MTDIAARTISLPPARNEIVVAALMLAVSLGAMAALPSTDEAPTWRLVFGPVAVACFAVIASLRARALRVAIGQYAPVVDRDTAQELNRLADRTMTSNAVIAGPGLLVPWLLYLSTVTNTAGLPLTPLMLVVAFVGGAMVGVGLWSMPDHTRFASLWEHTDRAVKPEQLGLRYDGFLWGRRLYADPNCPHLWVPMRNATLPATALNVSHPLAGRAIAAFALATFGIIASVLMLLPPVIF